MGRCIGDICQQRMLFFSPDDRNPMVTDSDDCDESTHTRKGWPYWSCPGINTIFTNTGSEEWIPHLDMLFTSGVGSNIMQLIKQFIVSPHQILVCKGLNPGTLTHRLISEIGQCFNIEDPWTRHTQKSVFSHLTKRVIQIGKNSIWWHWNNVTSSFAGQGINNFMNIIFNRVDFCLMNWQGPLKVYREIHTLTRP